MSDAAVGSVSHILKTAFKDVYESGDKANEAVNARIARDLRIAEKAKKREEAKKRAEEEAELQRQAAEEAAAAAASKAKKGAKEPPQEAVIEKPPIESDSDSEIDLDDPNDIANYYTRFQKVNLNESNKGIYENKVTEIDSNLVKSVEEAVELSSYLKEQRVIARELETEEEENLKKQGILVGQHIPSLPSKLDIKKSKLEQYGTYSSNLVVAHTLVQQNLENSMRRTGLLPISEVAQQKKANRHVTIGGVVGAATGVDGESTVKAALPPRIKDTAERRIANEDILKSINRKLNYLRNPHNNPLAVGKTLVKHVPEAHNGKTTVDIFNTSLSKKTTVPTIPLFAADPSTVTFHGHEIGEKYTCTVRLRNVSTISRSLRIIPPKRDSGFSLSSLQYPNGSTKGGLVAPGMCITTVVTFSPDSMGDYSCSVCCETEGGKFDIPLIAEREAPQLSIPSVLNVGGCLVGDATRVMITCHNTGGSGRFRLLRPQDYPNVPTDINWDTMGCMRLRPFTIYPVQFALGRDESINITIEYVPLTTGEHVRDFVMLCDNCQVRTFSVKGESKQINVNISEINQVPVDPHDVTVKKELYFDPVYVGSHSQQEVSVCNTTGIPLEYEWVWVPHDTKEKDMTRVGQEKILRREAIEANNKMLLDRKDAEAAAKAAGESAPGEVVEADDVIEVKNGDDMEKRRRSPPGSVAGNGSLLEDMSTAEMTQASTASSASLGPFDISPSRGVLCADGDQTFTVTYTSDSLTQSMGKVVLMLIRVPLVALPHPGQVHALNKLKSNGHGVFTRLLSWMREIGEPTRFNTTFGIGVEPLKLLSLHTLIGFVLDHLMSVPFVAVEDDSGSSAGQTRHPYAAAIQRFVNWTKLVCKHGVNNIAHFTEVITDAKTGLVPSPVVNLANENEFSAVVGFYLWKRAETAPSDGDEDSLNAHALTAKEGVVSVPPIMLDRVEKELFGWSDLPESTSNSGPGSRRNSRDNSDVEFNMEEGNVLLANRFDLDTCTTELNEILQNDMVSTIWFDFKHAIMMLGNDMCDYLNELVKHEAVEYIREHGHSHVACMSQKVTAIGKPQRLLVDPPSCVMAGSFCVGKTINHSVCLKNPASVMCEVEVNVENIVVTKLFPSFTEGALNARNGVSTQASAAASSQSNICNAPTEFVTIPSDMFGFDFPEKGMLLMSESSSTLDFSFTPKVSGTFNIAIPFKAPSRYILVDQFHLIITVGEPHMRFLVPEVDIGLVGVGVEEKKSITFVNESDVPARYYFKISQDVEPDLMNQALQMKRQPSVAAGSGSEGDFSVKRKGSKYMSARGTSRARSSRSALSSARSSRSNMDDGGSISSQDSYAIDNPLALLSVEPPAGLVKPREVKTVQVACNAGRLPQRVRATLDCNVYDESGSNVLTSSCLSLRGEVQAPKAILYPAQFDLGRMYIGQPTKFKLTLENISNLATKYRFERPGGDSTTYGLTYDNPNGTLPPKSKVEVNMTFEPYVGGLTDDVIAVKVFGIPLPLGFTVRALVKGVQLGFTSLLYPDSPIPEPLGKPTDTQYPLPGNPPEPPAIVPLDFGSNVALYERRSLRIAVRNFSAIPASFDVSVKNYTVGSKFIRAIEDKPVRLAVAATANAGPDENIKPSNPGTAKSNGNKAASGTVTRLKTMTKGVSNEADDNEMLLVPHEDGVERFHSEAGKKYMGFRLQRDDDRDYLTMGLGAAYLVEPGYSGVIPPWGVQVLTIRTFNDMPGVYNDELIVEVNKNGSMKNVNPLSFSIPLRMSVQGCPLFVEKDVVGMSVVRAGHAYAADGLNKPLLRLGHACVDSEPLVREFKVRNNGSKTGNVRWKVRSLSSKTNGPVKIEFKVVRDDPSGSDSSPRKFRWRAKSTIAFWDDLSKDSSFKISPTSASIPPFGRKTFSVTLFRTHTAGCENGLLTASVNYDNGDARNTSVSTTTAPSRNLSVATLANSSSSIANNFELTLYLQADLVLPSIKIDEHTFTVNKDENPTIIESDSSGTNSIGLFTSAPVLFAKGDGNVASRKSNNLLTQEQVCIKQLTLTNPLESSLVFTTAIEGPFILKPTPGSDDGELQSINALATTYIKNGEGDPKIENISNTSKFIATASSIGKIYNLLPQASAKFAIAFTPKRDLRESILQAATTSTAGQIKKELTTHGGKLILSFSKGQSMHIPITANITTPFLFASAPRMYFGVCSVPQSCSGTLLLSNPTDVPAVWKVHHIPSKDGFASTLKATTIRVKGFEPKGRKQEDDPSVFVITPDDGSVIGPTVSVTAAMAAPPNDVNRT